MTEEKSSGVIPGDVAGYGECSEGAREVPQTERAHLHLGAAAGPSYNARVAEWIRLPLSERTAARVSFIWA